MRLVALAVLLALSACTIFDPGRPPETPVAWRDLRIAHIAHPDIDAPGGAERLRQAAQVLAGERYLDAILVSGRLGGPSTTCAELLADANRPVIFAGDDQPGDIVEPFRDLAVFVAGAREASRAAPVLQQREQELRGRWGCALLSWAMSGVGQTGGIGSPEEDESETADLEYSLAAVKRIRACLMPADRSDVDRRAGLVLLLTEGLAGGHLRMVEVSGFRLRTWLRPLDGDGDPARDLPRTVAETR